MADYITMTGVENPVFKNNMGESYLKRANEYVDNMFVRRRGMDPATKFPDGSTIPPILRYIALHRAQELFCQDKVRREGDVWTVREDTQRIERIRFEKRFDPRDVDSQNIDYTSRRNGVGIKLYRT